MNNSLFPTANIPDYLLNLEYKGSSFAGMMEIGALKTEIAGLEDAIKIATQVLAKYKKVDFGADDLQIFIEAFEKASFRKKVKLIIKGLDKHPGVISLGMLLMMAFQTIPAYKADKLRDMSPALMAEIGDQVKIELLQNKEFLKSVADVVRPLEQNGDELFCAVPSHGQTTIRYEDRKEFTELAGEVEQLEKAEGDKFEILQGRINRVDLDARVRHIGFKVDREGVSIPATLAENLRNPVDMRDLLGQYVELEGTTTYQGGVRSHISITKYKIVRQGNLLDVNNSQ